MIKDLKQGLRCIVNTNNEDGDNDTLSLMSGPSIETSSISSSMLTSLLEFSERWLKWNERDQNISLDSDWAK